MKHFESYCDMGGYNGSQHYGARNNFIKAMKQKQQQDYSSQQCTQGSSSKFLSNQVFGLPFRCDDVNVKAKYEDTGCSESQWNVLGKAQKKRKNRSTWAPPKRPIIGQVTILTIQLVAEEKASQKKDKTPKKAKVKAVVLDDSSSDEDSDSDDDDKEEEEEEDYPPLNGHDSVHSDLSMSASTSSRRSNNPFGGANTSHVSNTSTTNNFNRNYGADVSMGAVHIWCRTFLSPQQDNMELMVTFNIKKIILKITTNAT